MGAKRNLKGLKFGRLTVLRQAISLVRADGRQRIRWYCECECGKNRIVLASSLTPGISKSCGCLHREITQRVGFENRRHGKSDTPTHCAWMRMRQRCSNPNGSRWECYGGRGIKICKRWDKFENFLKDMGERPAGLTLERKDVNKGYSPSNCKWATQKEQQNNRRNTGKNRLTPVS